MDFYYGAEGSGWPLVILCSECCLEVEKDCVGRDIERDRNEKLLCRRKNVEIDKGHGKEQMSLSDFNMLVRK